MGRIKTDMVKRTTRKLVTTHNSNFTRDFDKNKAVLKEFAEIRSKKLRNIIAGYSVRLKRQSEEVKRPRKVVSEFETGRGMGRPFRKPKPL